MMRRFYAPKWVAKVPFACTMSYVQSDIPTDNIPYIDARTHMMKQSIFKKSIKTQRKIKTQKHSQRWTETKTLSIQVKTDILCQIHGEQPISLPSLIAYAEVSYRVCVA